MEAVVRGFVEHFDVLCDFKYGWLLVKLAVVMSGSNLVHVWCECVYLVI